jgi:hypothetical protein
MARPRPPPAPPPDAGAGRRRRWLGLGAAAALASLAGGGWFLLSGRDGGGDDATSPLPTDLPQRRPTATEIADPEESRRAADLEERAGRYAALRAAFGEGRRLSAPSAARLEPALRALWPDGTVAWGLACVEQLCRVDAPAPAASWQPRLEADPAVRALAERVVVDPAGAATPAYLVLVPADAAPGEDALRAIEEEFRLSSDARECLSSVGATGKVEYDLRLDGSGYTFLQTTDLPLPVVDCVDRVLGRILDGHPPPRLVRSGSRTFSIRR